jgi:hypothetical protein
MMRARLIVLAPLAVLVVGTVALAGVAWAAEGGAPPLAATTDESALCQNPQQVLTVGPRIGDSGTTFTTTGNFFRVNYEVDFIDEQIVDKSAVIRVIDSSGQVLAEFRTLPQDTQNSFFVNMGPGTYTLEVDIDPDNNAISRVTVDDCVGTTTAPKVISNFPRNGGEVGPAANVTATFSEDMREASVVMNAFKLFKKGSTTQIAAQVSYDAVTDTATLIPTNNLKRGATYKAVVTTVAKDEAGNRLDQNDSRGGLQQKVWFFEIDN